MRTSTALALAALSFGVGLLASPSAPVARAGPETASQPPEVFRSGAAILPVGVGPEGAKVLEVRGDWMKVRIAPSPMIGRSDEVIAWICASTGRAWAESKPNVADGNTALHVILRLSHAIDLHYLESRSLPNALEDLLEPNKRTGKPFLEEIPLDPWGTPYAYRVTNPLRRAFEIASAGPDKAHGTADDVVYPPREK
jgi:hypothetical protein